MSRTLQQLGSEVEPIYGEVGGARVVPGGVTAIARPGLPPIELRCALAAPSGMPQSFRPLPFEIGLRSSAFRSIELDEAISAFGVFCPELKKQLQVHLRLLAQIFPALAIMHE